MKRANTKEKGEGKRERFTLVLDMRHIYFNHFFTLQGVRNMERYAGYLTMRARGVNSLLFFLLGSFLWEVISIRLIHVAHRQSQLRIQYETTNIIANTLWKGKDANNNNNIQKVYDPTKHSDSAFEWKAFSRTRGRLMIRPNLALLGREWREGKGREWREGSGGKGGGKGMEGKEKHQYCCISTQNSLLRSLLKWQWKRGRVVLGRKMEENLKRWSNVSV